MLVMAKKQTNAGGGRKALQVGVRLEPDVVEALDKLLATMRPKPTRPDMIRVALEDYLIAKGYLPSPSDE